MINNNELFKFCWILRWHVHNFRDFVLQQPAIIGVRLLYLIPPQDAGPPQNVRFNYRSEYAQLDKNRL